MGPVFGKLGEVGTSTRRNFGFNGRHKSLDFTGNAQMLFEDFIEILILLFWKILLAQPQLSSWRGDINDIETLAAQF